MTAIEIVPYSPLFNKSFKALNESWIKKYFEIEPEDTKVLGNPEKIIEEGGYIFVALRDSEAVGVCALIKLPGKTFEFSKMAVAENAQGLGIGRKLAEAAIDKAEEVGARRIYLEGNTKLEASIHLYRKLGFKEVYGLKAHYNRVNIIMEKRL